jgi:hypothetical protein
LSSLGGSENAGNSINDPEPRRRIRQPAGQQQPARDAVAVRIPLRSRHARRPNSNVPWPVKNTSGLIAGIAQTTTPQPRGETWSCRSFFAFPTRAVATCLGVVWEEGRIRALPTLGGDNGFATGANNHRQVVGWAENTVEDSSCVLPQKLQFHATLWGAGSRPGSRAAAAARR